MSVIVIEELTAPSGKNKRIVKLIGPSLPLMGTEWKSGQQIKTTWYAGNGEEATQHVGGPILMPSKWNGEWRRTMFSAQPALFEDSSGLVGQFVEPFDLFETIDDMISGAQRLRVTWSVLNSAGSAKRIVREGRAKEFSASFERETDIVWSIDWEWMSRGGTTTKAAASPREQSVVVQSQKLLAAMAKLKAASAAAQAAKFKPNALTLGQLENLANTPTKIANDIGRQVLQLEHQVKQITDIAKKLATQPLSVTASLVDMARNATALANQITDSLSREPPELLSLKNKVSDMLRGFKTFGAAHDDARAIARAANEFRAIAKQNAHNPPGAGARSPATSSQTSDIIGTYIVKQGDTPQSISLRFYESIDHSGEILKANRLPPYLATLPYGKILIIPRLGTIPTGT